MFTPKICYYLLGLRIPLFVFLLVAALVFRKQIYILLKSRIFPYLLICVPPAVIFLKIILNDPFFVSDDFDHLLLSYHSGYMEILTRAISAEGIWVGHRIVTGFWLFKLVYDFFGANIYPFVFMMFILNTVNVILLYEFVKLTVKNKIVPIVSSFIFGFYYLTWISTVHELLGAMFVLISLIFAVKRLQGGDNDFKFSLISLSSYLFAVFSKEITFLIFPAVLLIYMYYRKLDRKNLKFLVAFFVLFISYAAFFATGFLRYFGSGAAVYQMGFTSSTILSNMGKYLSTYSPAFPVYGFLITFFITLGVLVSVKRSGWLSLAFFAGFLAVIFPSLLFIDRTAPYYIYTPGIFLFAGLSVILDDVFSLYKNYFIKAVIILVCLIFVFGVDTKLRDSCFLIVSPWKTSQKQEFLEFISKVNTFEKDATSGETVSVQAGDMTDDLLTQYLNEGTPTDLIKAFLYPKGAGYNYSYNSEKRELVVQKE